MTIAFYPDLNGCVGDPAPLPRAEEIRAGHALADLDAALALIEAETKRLRAQQMEYECLFAGDGFRASDTDEVLALAEKLEAVHAKMEDV